MKRTPADFVDCLHEHGADDITVLFLICISISLCGVLYQYWYTWVE